ncbi:hypothetical protein JCM6882_004748 [Rhodosporidiobolus microsporus]
MDSNAPSIKATLTSVASAALDKAPPSALATASKPLPATTSAAAVHPDPPGKELTTPAHQSPASSTCTAGEEDMDGGSEPFFNSSEGVFRCTRECGWEIHQGLEFANTYHVYDNPDRDPPSRPSSFSSASSSAALPNPLSSLPQAMIACYALTWSPTLAIVAHADEELKALWTVGGESLSPPDEEGEEEDEAAADGSAAAKEGAQDNSASKTTPATTDWTIHLGRRVQLDYGRSSSAGAGDHDGSAFMRELVDEIETRQITEGYKAPSDGQEGSKERRWVTFREEGAGWVTRMVRLGEEFKLVERAGEDGETGEGEGKTAPPTKGNGREEEGVEKGAEAMGDEGRTVILGLIEEVEEDDNEDEEDAKKLEALADATEESGGEREAGEEEDAVMTDGEEEEEDTETGEVMDEGEA